MTASLHSGNGIFSSANSRAEGLILTHEEARSKLLLWARQELAYESVINSSVLLMHDW